MTSLQWVNWTINCPSAQYSDKRKQLTNHPNLRKWCFQIQMDLAYSTSIPSLEQETLILLKDILSQDVMILHDVNVHDWWQYTFCSFLWEISFSRVASFCQCTAVNWSKIKIRYSPPLSTYHLSPLPVGSCSLMIPTTLPLYTLMSMGCCAMKFDFVLGRRGPTGSVSARSASGLHSVL